MFSSQQEFVKEFLEAMYGRERLEEHRCDAPMFPSGFGGGMKVIGSYKEMRIYSVRMCHG